jgi:hypothetical protein
VHSAYVGGRQYFEESQDPESLYSKLFVRVPDAEIEVLNKRDRRYINNVTASPNLSVFRTAVVSYLVGGAIRMIQDEEHQRKYKCSFIIHTSTTKDRHQWQEELVEALVERLTELALEESQELIDLVARSYEDMRSSIALIDGILPSFEQVSARVFAALRDGYVGITKINSENQIAALLDKNGQLRLDNPFNVFIGGQILDRGITIDNLIGFFYGRNPKTFQQDTVLQHSRMYGARGVKDMAVTRLYTSQRIYNALLAMHEFDSALRAAFENGIHDGDDSVVFVERDAAGQIKPCAPSKILITSTQSIKPLTRFLPIGFQTGARTRIEKTIKEIDMILHNASCGSYDKPFLVNVETACRIVEMIRSTFEYKDVYENSGLEWDHLTFNAIMKRLQTNIVSNELKGQLYCYVQIDRNLSRKKNNGMTFSDAPDDGNTDRVIARSVASETACLMLLRQNGSKSRGWKDAEFWWPVLMTPLNSRPAVFASETMK